MGTISPPKKWSDLLKTSPTTKSSPGGLANSSLPLTGNSASDTDLLSQSQGHPGLLVRPKVGHTQVNCQVPPNTQKNAYKITRIQAGTLIDFDLDDIRKTAQQKAAKEENTFYKSIIPTMQELGLTTEQLLSYDFHYQIKHFLENTAESAGVSTNTKSQWRRWTEEGSANKAMVRPCSNPTSCQKPYQLSRSHKIRLEALMRLPTSVFDLRQCAVIPGKDYRPSFILNSKRAKEDEEGVNESNESARTETMLGLCYDGFPVVVRSLSPVQDEKQVSMYRCARLIMQKQMTDAKARKHLANIKHCYLQYQQHALSSCYPPSSNKFYEPPITPQTNSNNNSSSGGKSVNECTERQNSEKDKGTTHEKGKEEEGKEESNDSRAPTKQDVIDSIHKAISMTYTENYYEKSLRQREEGAIIYQLYEQNLEQWLENNPTTPIQVAAPLVPQGVDTADLGYTGAQAFQDRFIAATAIPDASQISAEIHDRQTKFTRLAKRLIKALLYFHDTFNLAHANLTLSNILLSGDPDPRPCLADAVGIVKGKPAIRSVSPINGKLDSNNPFFMHQQQSQRQNMPVAPPNTPQPWFTRHMGGMPPRPFQPNNLYLPPPPPPPSPMPRFSGSGPLMYSQPSLPPPPPQYNTNNSQIFPHPMASMPQASLPSIPKQQETNQNSNNNMSSDTPQPTTSSSSNAPSQPGNGGLAKLEENGRLADIYALGDILNYAFTKLSAGIGYKSPIKKGALSSVAGANQSKDSGYEAEFLIEAKNLIERLTDPATNEEQPTPDKKMARVDLKNVLKHPAFWSANRKLLFLCSVGSQLEHGRFNKQKGSTTAVTSDKSLTQLIDETNMPDACWLSKITACLLEETVRIKATSGSTSELILLIKHCHENMEELSQNCAILMIGDPYHLINLFPSLVVTVYNIVRKSKFSENAKLKMFY